MASHNDKDVDGRIVIENEIGGTLMPFEKAWNHFSFQGNGYVFGASLVKAIHFVDLIEVR